MKYIESYVHHDHQIGVLVEFESEYFTVRTPEFREYTIDIAMHVAALNPGKNDDEYREEALMDQMFVKYDAITVREYTNMFEKNMGAKVKVLRYERFSCES
jgi:translation elongation factor EF-Ts